jgi:hypothetical protein
LNSPKAVPIRLLAARVFNITSQFVSDFLFPKELNWT